MAEQDVATSSDERDDAAAAEEADKVDDHPPTVELSLYELNVSVRGTGSDSLDDVEGTATSLMNYLVEQHHRLEDGPEDHQVI
jgi:hypothetical protein